ncbi:MAG: hypothetical protein GEU76_10060 [Alphaproteobacteria bacterium]|nr:hypothetical protein [Alphaproteobacteria bacterium]
MFYNTRMRYHVKAANVLRDTGELRLLGDQFSHMARALGLGPKEGAILFILNTVRNTCSSETQTAVRDQLELHCQTIGVDFEAIETLDSVSRASSEPEHEA